MTVASDLKDNLGKVFKGSYSLEKFFKSVSASGDREIDTWDSSSTEMVKIPSGTTLGLIPRIKVKTERNWLRGKIKEFVEENQENIITNIREVLKLEGVWEWSFEEKVIGSLSGLQSYVISGAKEGKKPTIKIVFASKGLSNGAGGKREDPHELMTACLILAKMKINLSDINGKKDGERYGAYKQIVDTLASISPKIVGAAGLAGFYIDPKTKQEPDLINLAKAVSVSNYVIDLLGGAKVDAVWQTGTKWAQEIKKYDVGPSTIKNYNSSDIIVKFTTAGKNGATHYWGLSLKKAGISDPEPTLLNKPAFGSKGFIQKKMDPSSLKKVEDAKKKFYVGALKIKTGATTIKNKKIDSMPIKEVLKHANNLFTDTKDKSEMLTGQGKYQPNKNIYFEEMHKAFMKFDNNREFFEEFLDTIFKIKLQTYLQDASFHFSLITGRGDYKDGKILEVTAPSEKEGRTTSEVFRLIFGDSNNTQFRLIPNRTNTSNVKKMAFEEGATAAKLFYEMAIGPKGKEHSIVMLEVRYKGALTSEPQFQVFMSTKKNGFSDLYKAYVKKNKIERW
ncbi:hypothetical protein Syn7803C99_155 [Synechococcus phage ACG-2014a]|uniref:Uncharacterized protein n=1 Tax=Synechococcus phage ACG-2014a TaxID=1493507 RepID=A0A0E3IBS3_9CAUD|nr:hypothetical protein Syn7803C47_158 [Synechococcus phage ACG-2014a]AIX15853.1 hypothetical protein Syn7803C53_156 [Synechococcus phage ACG-2014a]AIX20838.1 hypothetical protein Syn7803C86_158 [Synechococcus phage ACG-2014a]AIX23138.1 hypothetical protein Syn7803C99_155 [Synechococcus phage ACG-2014a]AIX23842.1 hypothetical protein Syn7803US102_157 [Synechococcus phage ACG-2014a]